MQARGAIRWKLKVIMDRCQIGTTQLSTFMKVAPRTVTKWRQAEYMPEINERRFIQIFNAINELCDRNGTPNRKIKLGDLVEFCMDELRDFDVSDYQYSSGDARKKPASKQKSKQKDADGSNESTIAA